MENKDAVTDVVADGVAAEAQENLLVPNSAVATEETEHENEEATKPEFYDNKKEVSFHHAVEVAEIPKTDVPISAMTSKTDGEPLKEEPLKEEPVSQEIPTEPVIDEDTPTMEQLPVSQEIPTEPVIDEDTPTMEQLHNEGAEKTYQERRFGVQPQVVRRMKRVDIETGKRSWRELTALPVWDFRDAMNPIERKKGVIEGLARNKTEFDEDEQDDDDPQFRLASKNTDTKFGHKEHRLVPTYLHWTFRASFMDVILTDFLAFFFISWIWACCIYLGALVSPRCFVVAGTPLSEMDNWRENFYFMDAFQLSWTTFSTVGYGVVYPNVNKGSVSARPDCFVFSFMVTLESFVGVLFAAFCGSIIFGKIARVQSIAPIQWSDPIVIRYGTGVLEKTTKPEVKKIDEGEDDSDSDSDSDDDESVTDAKKDSDNTERTGATKSGSDLSVLVSMDKSSTSQKSSGSKVHKFPPPVLEFRVINSLNQQDGGEIMNASLNVYASTEASKSMESLQLTESNNSDTLTAARLLKMSLELTQKTGRALARTKDACAKATHLTGSALHRSSAAASKSTGTLVQRVNRAISRPSTFSTLTVDGSIDETQPELQPFNKQEQDIQREIAMASLAYAANSTNHIAVDEGSGLVPRRIFSKMEIETDTHPFFKRVWNIRHVLNEDSPLLSAKAKRILHKHNGKWPQDICNASFIRKNIHFHQIIVQLSGTQNSSGSDVAGMKVYEFQSLNIGYRFAQCMDVGEDDKLYVDTELLNDVQEQRGGGGEKIRGHMVDEFGDTIHDEDDLLHSGTSTVVTEDKSMPIKVE